MTAMVRRRCIGRACAVRCRAPSCFCAAARPCPRGRARVRCAHVAAQYEHTGILYHFKIRWDAHLDALDLDGRSPLHWAAYKGFRTPSSCCSSATRTCPGRTRKGARPALGGDPGQERLHVLAQAGGLALMEATDSEEHGGAAGDGQGHKSLGGFWRTTRIVCVGASSKNARRVLQRQRHGHGVPCTHSRPRVHVRAHRGPRGQHARHGRHLAAFVAGGALAGAGLFLMYRVSTADPGFVDAAHATVLGAFGGAGQPGTRPRAGRAPPLERRRRPRGRRRGTSADHPGKAGNWSALCPTCRSSDPGALHCSVTNRCVKRFDHYCPWMGNVIGKNLRDFVFSSRSRRSPCLAFGRRGAPAPRRADAGPFTMTSITVFLVFDGAVLFPVGFLFGRRCTRRCATSPPTSSPTAPLPLPARRGWEVPQPLRPRDGEQRAPCAASKTRPRYSARRS